MSSISRGARILLVDDNAVVRDMLVDLVGSLGHSADAASGGVEALALFDRNRYDIVLTDLLMPGRSGWEVLVGVRQRDPQMPVIIITGTPAIGDPRAALPGVAVLKKPVDVMLLNTMIKRMVNRPLAV
jgi:CheY-like chemotaxis protein